MKLETIAKAKSKFTLMVHSIAKGTRNIKIPYIILEIDDKHILFNINRSDQKYLKPSKEDCDKYIVKFVNVFYRLYRRRFLSLVEILAEKNKLDYFTLIYDIFNRKVEIIDFFNIDMIKKRGLCFSTFKNFEKKRRV